MKSKFDDPTIRNLKLSEKTYDCMADKEPGFGIRVHPSGTMTFFYLYKIDGQRRFMTLGNYPTDSKKAGEVSLKNARHLYQAEQAKVKALRRGSADGSDPVKEKKRKQEQRIAEETAHSQSLSVSDLIKEYIKKHAEPSKRSWKEDERILNKDALAVWGKRKASDIKKRDVVLLLESIIERGSPGSANSNFKIIRKMFRFAVQRDILEHSPCDGVVMPAPMNRGDRTLTEAEIKTLWSNLDTCNISDDIRRAIRLILVTGQRPGEVIGMHTSEIELIIEKEKVIGAWWKISAERSKNKKAHRVFLTGTALDLIGNLKKIDKETGKEVDKGFIFPCTNLKKVQPMGRLSISQAVWRNLASPTLVNGKPVFDKKGEPVTENKLGVADFVPHDLRRTAATFMSQLGFMDEVIDAVLNHTKQGIIRTYNLNRYDKEKQQTLESWERKLNSIVTGEASGKIISIQQGRKIAK